MPEFTEPFNDPPFRTPVPDPTKLTTEALQREIAGLKELFFSALAGMKEATGARIARIDDDIARSEVLRNEKFTAVSQRIELLREHRLEQKGDSDRALARSEESMRASIDSSRRELSDLKDRVTSLESVRMGIKENTSNVYAMAGLLITFGLLAVGGLTYVVSH